MGIGEEYCASTGVTNVNAAEGEGGRGDDTSQAERQFETAGAAGGYREMWVEPTVK